MHGYSTRGYSMRAITHGYSTRGITYGYSTRGMWVSMRGTMRDVYAPCYKETWSTQTCDGMHGGATRGKMKL